MPRWEIHLPRPAAWLLLRADPAADQAEIPAKVEAFVAAEPRLAIYREAIMGTLLGWSGTAAQLGAAFAGWRWASHASGWGMSSLLATRHERLHQDPDTELARLRDLLAEEQPFDQFPPRLAAVRLAMGPGLRMDAVRQATGEPGRPQPLRLVVDYWLPVAGEMLLLSFSTSNLAMGSELAAEYEAMVQGLSIDVEG